MPTTIDWGVGPLTYAGVQRVYVRQRWAIDNPGHDPFDPDSDQFLESPWLLQSNLWCQSVTWSLLPSIPVAELILDYGRVMPHGTNAIVTQSRLDLSGWYVKIEHDCADGTISWFGFIDEIGDQQGGTHSGVPTGRQTFVAYSIAQVLAHAIVDHSWWANPDWNIAADSHRMLKSESGIAFNEGGRPNRTDVFPEIANGAFPFTLDYHMFYPRNAYSKKPSEPAVLKYFEDSPAYWSSRDIALYLQRTMCPLDSGGMQRIPFRIDNLEIIPNWDKPTIETEGQSVLSILGRLVSHERMMQISVQVDDSVVPNQVVLEVSSTIATAITLPTGAVHPANTGLLDIQSETAQDTNISVQQSTSAVANQIVVKGAEKETCLTARMWKPDRQDQCFQAGWTFDQEDKYNDGASTDAAYGTLPTLSDQQRANQIARNKADVNDAFKVLSIDPFHLLDKQYATGAVNDDYFVFNKPNPSYNPGIAEDPATNPKFIAYYPFWNAIVIKPVLPFKLSLDYSGAVAPADDESLVEYRAPYVLFKHPTKGVYLQAEKMSAIDGDPRFSVGIGLTKDSHSLSLDVQNGLQHEIAAGHFVPLPEDEETPTWTFDDCYFTISLLDDRRLTAVFPEDVDLPEVDVVRRKVIYAGESFRQVRVVDETVVDLSPIGALKKTQVGLTDGDQYMINDEAALKSIAKIAAYWFTVVRRVLRLTTPRPTATAAVGQIVVTANANSIGTVITQISLQTPLGDNLSVQPARFEIMTARSEADPLAFTPGYRPHFSGKGAIHQMHNARPTKVT